jgi:hypothetical protein
MSVGKMTVTYANGKDSIGLAHTFSSMLTADGHVPFWAWAEEVLGSPGVNGFRWRRRDKQFPAFVLTTTAGFADFGTAEANALLYEATKTAFVRLEITVGGAVQVYKRVKVEDVKPRPHPHEFNEIGFATAAAWLECDWTLRQTDFSS